MHLLEVVAVRESRQYLRDPFPAFPRPHDVQRDFAPKGGSWHAEPLRQSAFAFKQVQTGRENVRINAT